MKGAYWLWGYDEISWFGNQSQAYRAPVAPLCLGLGQENGSQRLPGDAG